MRIQLFNLLFEKYSQKSREKKVEEFFRLMDPIENDTLLDVGGGVKGMALGKFGIILEG